jgi:hypothetical protein
MISFHRVGQLCPVPCSSKICAPLSMLRTLRRLSPDQSIESFREHNTERDGVAWCFRYLFGKCSVRISARTPALITEHFHPFPQSLKENTVIVHRLRHNHFLQDPFQFITLSLDSTKSIKTTSFIPPSVIKLHLLFAHAFTCFGFLVNHLQKAHQLFKIKSNLQSLTTESVAKQEVLGRINQSQIYFTTGSLPPISSSCRQAPWDSRPVFFPTEHFIS